jgi:hypothetical protein
MNRHMTPEKRQAILALWRQDKPLTEIMFVCHVSAPTVRKIAKDEGLFPRASDAKRRYLAPGTSAAELTPEEVEQRKLEVQARWSEAERRHAWQHHHPATIRTYGVRGYGLVEVGQ